MDPDLTEPGEPPAASAGKTAWRRWARQGRRANRESPAPVVAEILADPRVEAALDSRPHGPVLAYVSTAGEPPTEQLRARLRSAGRQVLLPWALPDRQLLWLADDGGDSTRAWGLPGVTPPAVTVATMTTDEALALQPAVVLVPALAATHEGLRLGQGGGYYDTLLSRCSVFAEGGPLRVALVWPWERVRELPVDVHDEAVDIVITC